MATDAQGRQLSDNGNYYWDGANWQLVAVSGGNGATAGAGQTITADDIITGAHALTTAAEVAEIFGHLPETLGVWVEPIDGDRHQYLSAPLFRVGRPRARYGIFDPSLAGPGLRLTQLQGGRIPPELSTAFPLRRASPAGEVSLCYSAEYGERWGILALQTEL